MNLVEETNFANQFLGSLSSRAVKYPQDFAPPPQTRPQPPVRTAAFSSFKTTTKSTVFSTSENAQGNVGTGTLIKLNIKSLKGGKTYSTQLNDSETVLGLKEKLRSLASISPENQRLIFKGKALVDNKPLSEYGISNDTTIHLVQKSGTREVSQISKESKLSTTGIEKVKDPQFIDSLSKFFHEQFSEVDANCILKDFTNFYNV
ncbi:5960_t:CDS:2 [Diversispora eburnea]|uniref:5960_t:CDS:1 n=1 Tax=Diversispora eburnea TaxID=1213867 RepID=A0A9N9AUT0_9GLOM|nr:5960_t:CDS:2 [Diversispora eburnea]